MNVNSFSSSFLIDEKEGSLFFGGEKSSSIFLFPSAQYYAGQVFDSFYLLRFLRAIKFESDFFIAAYTHSVYTLHKKAIVDRLKNQRKVIYE